MIGGAGGDMSSPKSAPGYGPISRGALRDDSVKTSLKAGGIAIGKPQRDVGSVVAAGSRYHDNTSIFPLSRDPHPDGGREPGHLWLTTVSDLGQIFGPYPD